jgi:hypothetical protein
MRFALLVQMYQRYLLICVGVLGFVAATFMVGASSLLESMYSRTGDFGEAVYSAVHMPYLQSVYSFAGFASVALGFGVIRELHEKLHDLLCLTPVSTRQLKDESMTYLTPHDI